jgi:hypothetical protein
MTKQNPISLKNMMYNQLTRAEIYILHVAKSEFQTGLPVEFDQLLNDGLIVKWVENTGPYKKFESVPEYDNDYYIMVDDDMYYPLDFIEQMVRNAEIHPDCITMFLSDGRMTTTPSTRNEFHSGNTIIPPRCWPMFTIKMIPEAYKLVPYNDEAFFYPWLVWCNIKLTYIAEKTHYDWNDLFIADSQHVALKHINGAYTGQVQNRDAHHQMVLDAYPQLRAAYTQRGAIRETVGKPGVGSKTDTRTPEPVVSTSAATEYIKILRGWKPNTTK